MLRLQGISKISDERVVLAIPALEVAAGQMVAIVGPAAEGASLLIRLLCGELAPSGGTITFDDHPLSDPTVRSRMGMLFADDLLYERLTVQENLDFIAQMRTQPPAKVAAILEQLGLSDQVRTRVSKLAPAQQRRVALARAILAQQGLLVLERPIARVDLATQALLVTAIQAMATAGVAILIIDDDLTWVGRFCQDIYEMANGHIVAHITPGVVATPLPLPTEPPSSPSADLTEAEPAPPAPEPERFVPFKVPARRDDRIVLFDPGEILYATSRDGRTYLRTAHEEAVTNLTLQELEGRLVGRGFFKAHRAYLVNLQHIRSVIQYTRNSYSLQLSDVQQTTIPLSKQSEKELQDLLGY